MARPSEHDGVLYRQSGTKFWWMRYHDRVGKRCQETTGTSDWHEAQKKLRERLQARDDNILHIVCKGEQLPFEEWVDFFLENYSKPPLRAPKTHEANSRAAMHLKTAFGLWKLADVSGEAIEGYLRHRLRAACSGENGGRGCEGRFWYRRGDLDGFWYSFGTVSTSDNGFRTDVRMEVV